MWCFIAVPSLIKSVCNAAESADAYPTNATIAATFDSSTAHNMSRLHKLKVFSRRLIDVFLHSSIPTCGLRRHTANY